MTQPPAQSRVLRIASTRARGYGDRMGDMRLTVEGQRDRVLVKSAPSPDGEHRGFLDMRLEEPGHLYLASVEVKPEWQGQGIGSAMFDAALATFQNRGPVHQVSAHLATAQADQLWASARRRHGRDIRFYAIGDD